MYGSYYKVKSFFNDREGHFISVIRNNHLTDLPIDENTLGQYTGLYDKNGKEIYEGDIISNGYEKCVVVWIKEQAGFMLKLLDKEYEKEEWTNPMIDIGKDDEVIGNIYDNTELLKENRDGAYI